MFCTHCGQPLQADQIFCGQCGQRIHPQNGGHLAPTPAAASGAPITEQELGWFAGSKAEAYLQKWRTGSRWNWAAFLFDAHWLMYRKMYLYSVLYLLVWAVWSNVLVASLFSRWNPVERPGLLPLVVLLCLIPKPLLGVFADRLYLHQAKRKIGGIVCSPNKQQLQEAKIAAAGGTNLALPLIVLALPGLVALTGGLYTFLRVYYLTDGKVKQAAASTSASISAPSGTLSPVAAQAKEADTGRINILLLGGDSRSQSELGAADTIMLASLDPGSKKISLFSILRDTYVQIPGYGESSMVRALPMGGPDLARRTTEEWTGLSIPYYLYLDMQGFIRLTDAMGGIPMDVEKNMSYADSHDDPQYDIHLKKGYQRLDGAAALQYVRFRHDAMGEYGRTERQRKLVQNAARELIAGFTIKELPQWIQAVQPFIETNIGIDELLKLGLLAFQADIGNMDSLQLPPVELIRERSVNGKGVIYIDDPAQLRAHIGGILESGS